MELFFCPDLATLEILKIVSTPIKLLRHQLGLAHMTTHLQSTITTTITPFETDKAIQHRRIPLMLQ
jgi:hypothetical protein